MKPYSEQKIISREAELDRLQTCLEMVAKGQGTTLFISGEAGVGKTRLVNELKTFATSRGFTVLSGNSIHESVAPYLPVLEALKSGGLEHLFAEETPTVEAIYLVTRTGLLIKSVLREESDLDSDVFASMLITVGDFVRDSLSLLSGKKKEGGLNSLGYGEYRILIESGKSIYLAVIMRGRENEFLVADMQAILKKVNREFGGVLEDWDGTDKSIFGIDQLIEPLIKSGKYDGVYFGKDDPRARRNLLFESISLGLGRYAELVPILLCIEDLQWADPSSITLLHYIARNTQKRSLFIVGTYRPEDVASETDAVHPLVATMQLMAREDLYEVLDLNRLSKDKTKDFLSSLLGRFEFDEEILTKLYSETEGNPLYLVELVNLMAADGFINIHGGAWRLSKSHDEFNVPSKVHDVITRRLGRLQKEERRVMDIASVVGDLFETSVLSSALHMEKIHLLEQIRILERTHRLVHSYDGIYSFDHTKIREVLYNEIPRELRGEYHALIAQTIEKMYKGKTDEVVNVLALHYYRCKDQEKAPLYLALAADRARSEYSNAEAVNLYRQVLEFEKDADKRFQVFDKIGSLQDVAGDLGGSIEAYEQALTITDEKRKRAEILGKISNIREKMGEYEEAMRFGKQSLSLVEGEGTVEEARALIFLGNVHLSRGELDDALGRYKKATVICEAIADEEGLLTVLKNIGNSHLIKGETELSLEAYGKSLEIGERIGDQRGSAHCLSNIGAVHHQKGEYEAAIFYFKKAMEMFEKIGDKQGIAYILNNIGVMYEERSEYNRALDYYRQSLEILERIGEQQGIVACLHNVGKIHHYMGDYVSAIAQFEKSLGLSEKIGSHMGLAFNFCGIAESYFESNQFDRAQEYAKKGYELSKDAGFKEYQAMSCRVNGLVHREKEEWKEATESFRESIAIFNEIGMGKEAGKSHYEFGLMWKAMGNSPNAKEQLEKAVELFKNIGLEKELKRAQDVRNSLQ